MATETSERKLIAVLRYITPEEAEWVSDLLVEEGFTWIEVTANSRGYEESLARITGRHPKPVKIGAGTVLSEEELLRVHRAGASFIVSPHTDTGIIRKTKSMGLLSLPGIFTPTEAITAMAAGADALKFFPANWAPPSAAKDLKAVLPPGTQIYALGGVSSNNFVDYLRGGFDGFGLGSSLFHPGISPQALRERSRNIIANYDRALSEVLKK